ncbi:MAG TPA: MFS transporter [Pseudonocardiaceae bacterium]|jgi:SHS family lactate transporter-like MFS transporter|nr:MFS transporter [Pseudonocardiaceae bacterium]
MPRSLAAWRIRSPRASLTPDQRNSFIAALLGWSMDAFDYLLVVMVLGDIAQDSEFRGGVPEAQFAVELAFITTATLVMRPVGALIFGLWADRVGRRIPLIVDVLLYSVCGALCAIAPNLTVLLILRFCAGIGMGGEWGLGAALVMEKIPPSRRGFFSGILQIGYPLGSLLASLAYLLFHFVLHLHWRWIFVLSIVPALIGLLVRSRVRESEVWETTQEKMYAARTSIKDILFDRKVILRFGYLVLLMTAFNWMSHGAQDIDPKFLRATSHGGAALSPTTASWIVVLYSIGGMVGCVICGNLSERFGRRYTMIACVVLGLPLIPIFAFAGHGVGMLALGSFLMQVMVQAPWGVIPAYLTEMSPDAIRGFYPGMTFQLGNLFAALSLPIEEALAEHHGYSFALTVTMIPALVAVIVLTAIGTEAKGIRFGSAPTPALAHHLRT